MKFELNGSNYLVRFSHNNSSEGRHGRSTTAQLLKTESDHTVLTTGAFAVSFCNEKDNFVRSTGRKLAFTRLLDNMQNLGIITKENRANLWETYFQNFKKA